MYVYYVVYIYYVYYIYTVYYTLQLAHLGASGTQCPWVCDQQSWPGVATVTVVACDLFVTS